MQYKYDLQKLQQGGLIMREYHLIRRKLSFIHQPLSEISSPNMIRFWLLLQDLIKNMNLNLFRSLHLWIYTNLLMSLLFYWLMRRESNNITLLLLNMLCLLTWYIRDNKRNSIPTQGINFKTIHEISGKEKVETMVNNLVVALNLKCQLRKIWSYSDKKL